MDFADIKAVMEKSGDAIIGIGIGMGEDRAVEAAKQAVSSPLLETSITGATDAIINITGGVNLTLFEAEQAAEVVRNAANNDINTIFGSVINENLTDEVIVTVIATGFNKQKPQKQIYDQQASKNKEITIMDDDDDDDEGESEYDFPPFLRNRNF